MNLTIIINEEGEYEGKTYKIFFGFTLNKSSRLKVKKGRFIGKLLRDK